MNTPSVQELMTALQKSWCKETSFTPNVWTRQNPARGQCLASTLVVQDYFGGDIRRYTIKDGDFEETHYCNIFPSGALFDSTAIQYSRPIQLTVTPIHLKDYPTARERYIAEPNTRTLYNLLKERVSRALLNR